MYLIFLYQILQAVQSVLQKVKSENLMVVNLATEVMEKILSLGKVCTLFVEVQCCLFMLQVFFFRNCLKIQFTLDDYFFA